MDMASVAHVAMAEIKEARLVRCVAQYGCMVQEARTASQQFHQEVWAPALRILTGMAMQKAARDRTGQVLSSITDDEQASVVLTWDNMEWLTLWSCLAEAEKMSR